MAPWGRITSSSSLDGFSTRGAKDADACTLARTLAQARWDDGPRGTAELLTPLLPALLSEYPAIVWPIIGQQLTHPSASTWGVRRALAGPRGLRDDDRPPILFLPPDALLAWCGAYPNEAPACAAHMLPFLSSDDPRFRGRGCIHSSADCWTSSGTARMSLRQPPGAFALTSSGRVHSRPTLRDFLTR